MIFITGVQNIKVKVNDDYIFEIKTVQTFEEWEDRVILKCV